MKGEVLEMFESHSLTMAMHRAEAYAWESCVLAWFIWSMWSRTLTQLWNVIFGLDGPCHHP